MQSHNLKDLHFTPTFITSDKMEMEDAKQKLKTG